MGAALRFFLICLTVGAFAQGRPIQKPGEIQKVTGTWQKPGEIQEPGDIQQVKSKCEERYLVGTDALFEFDKAALSANAEETLKLVGPMVRKAGKHPVLVEGHTDALGNDAYNQTLSEKRAEAVRDWLQAHDYLGKENVVIKGFGKKRLVAPNTKTDGSDNPDGRQKNRRVEVAIDLCK
jgi:outer membrane protein OmpA-like peptidoglycan-associated protein